MGFVAPAVSIIGGVAGIAAKNQQARAQQEQINQASYQAKVSQMANSAILERQQGLARQEYEISTLGRLQSYQQQQAGLQLQVQQAALKNEQEAYNIQYQALQQRGALDQTQQQLERQRFDIESGTNSKVGASLAKEGGMAAQLNNQTLKEIANQTEEDRRRISAQAAGRMASSSSVAREERSLITSISTALSQGLDVDRTAIQSYIQQLGEEEQLLLAERIGLNDNASNMDTVSANIRLAAMGAEGALQQNAADFDNTQNSAQLASKLMTQDANAQAKAAQDAYKMQDFSLGVQRDTAAKTGQSVQSAYQSASSNTRGAGFVDFLNLGVSAYGAVSPLLAQNASVADKTKSGLGPQLSYSNPVKFSGYVPNNNA